MKTIDGINYYTHLNLMAIAIRDLKVYRNNTVYINKKKEILTEEDFLEFKLAEIELIKYVQLKKVTRETIKHLEGVRGVVVRGRAGLFYDKFDKVIYNNEKELKEYGVEVISLYEHIKRSEGFSSEEHEARIKTESDKLDEKYAKGLPLRDDEWYENLWND